MEARVIAGIGYRKVHFDALLRAEGETRPDVLEVIPDHFFGDQAGLEQLASRYAIVLHDVGLSIGTAGAPSGEVRARTIRIKEVARVAKPILFSDHLAITRSPSGVDLGHLAPVWRTKETLDLVADRVRALEDALGVGVALENIAAPFEIPGAEMTEPEFFARLVDRTGCGMLLDVANIVVNARNFGFDAAAHIAAYPLSAVKQIHLAGGVVHKGFWVDSHSAPVEEECYRLLRTVKARAVDLEAIIVERDEKIPDLGELTREAKRAEREWESA
jgi:uncharacterized protein (UPF0276 family)